MRLAPLLVPDVEEILRTDPPQVAELSEQLHHADLADVLGALSDEHAQRMPGALPLEVSVATLDALDLPRRLDLFRALDPGLAARFANRMSPDDRADLFAQLPEELRAD